MNECAECLEEIKWGEKVFACTQGRRLSETKAIEIDFYHIKCWNNKYSNLMFDNNDIKEEDIKTCSAWEKELRRRYR